MLPGKKARVERADNMRSGSSGKNRAQHKRARQEVQEIFFPDMWCGRKLLCFIFLTTDRVMPENLKGSYPTNELGGQDGILSVRIELN